MAIAALLGSGMRAAGGAMVKSGAKGLTKGMIGRRGKKAQQQQPEVQQVDVRVVNEKPQTGNQISGMSSFLSLPSAKKIGSSGAKGVSGVEEKLNLIKSLFAERFAYAKSKSRQDDIEKDRKRKEKREKELEKEEKKSKAKVKSKNALPRVGLFDSIRNFIFYTFLAFLEKRFNFSQMLIKALPVILNVGKFIIDISGKILDGLATFIDFGYGLVDKTREFVKNLGGEGVLQAFDKMLGAINTVLNLLFIYAMAQSAFGLGGGGKKGGPRGSTRPTTRPGQGLRPKVTTTGGRGANRPDIRNPLRDRPKVTTTGGGTAGRPDIRNPLRSRPTVTTGVGKEVVEGAGKKVAGEAAEQITKKTAQQALGKFVRPFVGRIPILGALIDFGISAALGDPLGRAATRATGSGMGAAAGSAIAGSLGTILGSVVPVVGNFLGGAAGTLAGGAIGGFIGDWLGGWLYDTVAGTPKVEAKSKGGAVRRYEEGGSVEEDVQKKLLKKDEIRISEPLLDEKKGRGLGKILGKKGKAAAEYVRQSGKAFSKVPIIGPVLALATDKLLGNETDPNAFQAISNSLTNFSTLSASGETKSSGDYEKFTMKYASGGEVQTSGLGLSDPMETSRSLGRFLNTKFNAITFPGEGIGVKSGSKKEKGETKEGSTAGPGSAAGNRDSATGALTPGSQTGTAPGTATGVGTPEQMALLDAISFAEGTTKSYGTIFGGKVVPELEKGELTIDQVHAMMMTGKLNGRDVGYATGGQWSSVATGRYQFMPDTLRDIQRNMGLSGDTLFTPEMQDKMILDRISSFRGVTPELLAAEGLSTNVLDKLAPEFASLPSSEKGGKSFYGQPVKSAESLRQTFNSAVGAREEEAQQAQMAQQQPQSAAPGGDMAADVERGDPSEAASRLLQDFPQIQARANSQQIYASGLGFFLKQSGAGIQGQGDFGNPPGGDMEHPDHGGVVASHKGQGHYKGQALDLGANSATSGSYQDDQKKLWPFISQFLKKYGLDQEPTVPQVIHGPGESFSPKAASSFADGAHHNHFHVEFQGGGLIGKSTKQYGDMSTKASYEKTGSRVMVQPIIIEKQAPQDNFMMNPMDKLTFAGRGRLNNTPAFSRG